MLINGIEAQSHEMSYDKIIKHTLAQSDELTIRFINGLFGDNIPLDTSVAWLDKESVNDKHVGLVADFYPLIGNRMYSIEIEHDDKGDMAVRVFKYTVGGAILHGMSASDASLNIAFPQPCVVFLKSNSNTPKSLTWNLDFFDGQKITLSVPTIRLAELSIKEIGERDLLPIGQFYLRTYDKVTKKSKDRFVEETESLLGELKKAMDTGTVPYHIAVQMQKTIRETYDNVVAKSKEEVDLKMMTSITETLPWIDFGEVFRKIEERGRVEGEAKGKAEGRAEGKAEGRAEGKAEGMAEGEAQGRAERDMEISLHVFAEQKDTMRAIKALQRLGISDETINEARKQQPKSRTDHER